MKIIRVCKTPKCNGVKFEDVDEVYERCMKCGQLFIKIQPL
jgi:hypothetical protein